MPNQKDLYKIAKRITKVLIADFTDRRGFDYIWDDLDNDIKKEIRDEWARLIVEELSKDNGC